MFRLPSFSQPISSVLPKLLLVAGFLVSIGGVCVLTFLGPGVHRTVSVAEKRRLPPLPRLPHDWVAAAAFPRQFEAWFNDHFFGRDRLVELHNILRLRVFQQSTNASVVVGQQGWLYFNHLDDYSGLVRYSPLDDYRGLMRVPSKVL